MSLRFDHITGEPSLKAELNRNYARLDRVDTPRAEGDRSTRIIKPIGNNHSLTESVQLNYKKRALSYTHGALLAIRYTLDFEQAKAPLKSVIDLYNDFETEPDLTYKKIKNFLKQLSLLLKPYGITAENIRSGEMIANLERKRVTKLESQSKTAHITEYPQGSQLNHPAILKQYEFIIPLSQNNDFNVKTSQALETYQHMSRPEKTFLKAIAAVGWALEKCGCSANGYFSRIMSQLQLIRDKNKALQALTQAKAPQWYQKQNRVVQEYLIAHAGDETLPSIPATLRGIPGLPNMSIHEGRFTGDFPLKHSVIRHGTLTPYEMDEWNERESAAIANGQALAGLVKSQAAQNFAEFWTQDARNSLKKKIPVADISFMSPTHGEAAIGGLKKKIWGRNKGQSIFLERYSTFKFLQESNRAMKLENKEAYLKGISSIDKDGTFDTSSTNLGVNGDRWMFSTSFRSETYQDQIKLTLKNFRNLYKEVSSLRKTGQTLFMSKAAENKFLLADLASTDLESMALKFNKSYFAHALSTEADISELINAELFASCLNALVIQGMGGTVSACCKSSKDRTGLFLLHLDAMHQYYAETGELISFKADERSPERIRFVEIMADLYLGSTQQTMASQTTYGAFGLKEPNGISGNVGLGAVPPDLEAAIERKCPGLLKEQKYLAKANKVGF